MTILLTGATGFIGSHVAHTLVERGHDVRVSVRPQSHRERIADVEEHVEFVTCDLFAPDADLRPLCDGVDLCIHAAWYAEPGKYAASPKNVDCMHGSLRLLEALAEAGCRRAVYIGTCFEYDFTPGYLGEESPVGPQSLYAAAKASTGFVAAQRAEQLHLPFAWVRLFYQYGPYEDSRRLVPYVVETLLKGEEAGLTEGTQVRDFLHVADVARAIVDVANSALTGVVNVGSGRPVTVRDIAVTIAEILHREELVRFGVRPENPTDPPFICANNQRLLRETDWEPHFDLRSGLADTIDWWRARHRKNLQ